MHSLTLRAATVADTDVLFHLMQFYYFEASAWSGEVLRADGLYDCDRADVEASLRADPGWAHLLWQGQALVGFVLVDTAEFEGQPLPELADLFVLPAYRRQGIAAQVVAALVRPDTGQWLLATYRKDVAAHAFWARNLAQMGMQVQIPAVAADGAFHLFLIRASAAPGAAPAG